MLGFDYFYFEGVAPSYNAGAFGLYKLYLCF
jgi:hypothetical protein